MFNSGCEVLILTQMTNSGRILSFPIGLFVKATVATGASAKNIFILLASSGIVENAIKAAKAQTDHVRCKIRHRILLQISFLVLHVLNPTQFFHNVEVMLSK